MENDTLDILAKESRVCQALVDLDQRLAKMNVAPFELNVIGGFAMLLEGIRPNKKDYTDVDYVGSDFKESIQDVIQQVGLEWGFEKNWVNNDAMLAGSDLESLEFATGPLKFNHKMTLSVITVNTLDIRCILRMKVIAVDTNVISYGGTEFDRFKDFFDIKLLADRLGMGMQEIKDESEEWVVAPEETYAVINYFLKTGNLDIIERYGEIVAEYAV